MIPDPVDFDLMARTIYGEARGETDAHMACIAWVIRNRAAKGGWWGDTPAHVCLCRAQFSCWNKLDPNRLVIADFTIAHPSYRKALRIAGEVMDEKGDPTLGATHYHRDDVTPQWAEGEAPCMILARHKFYNSIR